MPSTEDHLSKAQHNEAFASSLNQDNNYASYRDWVVTGYFYSAIHYIEAYLATKTPPIHSADHRARDAVVGSDSILLKIYDDYGELKDDSTNARYEMWQPSPVDMSNYVQPNHDRIKNYLLTKIP